MYLNSTADSHFTILPIGTCRLDGPLRAGAGRRGFVSNGKRIYGYAHSISEIVQQVKFLHGDYTPDPTLWHVIAKHNLTRVNNERFRPADLTLVEISSRKQLFIDGHAVQINRLKTACAPFFDDATHTTRFWNAMRAADQSEQTSMIAAFASRFGLTSDQQHILHRLRMSETTDDELKAGLIYLRDALSNPMIVTHVDAQKSDGTRLANRSACIEQVTRMADQASMSVFNPTTLMQALGQDRAIEADSASFAHFTDLFACHLFDAWHAEFLCKRIDERMHKSTDKSDLRKYETHMRACLASDGIEVLNRRIDQLIAESPPLATKVKKMAVRLNVAADRVDQAQAIAASLVMDGHFDRNLFFHATQHASRHADTGLLRRCIELACEQPQLDTNLWLAPALAALAKLDAKAASEIYLDLLQSHLVLSTSLLPAFCDLLDCNAHLVDKAALADLPIHLIAEAVDGELLTRLSILAGSDKVSFLFAMLAQRPKYFMASFRTLAGDDLVSTMRAQQAIFVVLSRSAQLDTVMAKSLVVNAECESDLNTQFEMLSCALELDPANKAAKALIMELGKACLVRAKAAYKAEDIRALRSELDLATQIVPPVDHVAYLLARLTYAQEDFQEALRIAQRAVDYAPDEVRNWTMVLRSSVMLQNLDLAEHAALQVLETASTADTKAKAEAKKRLLWARKGMWARATVSADPIDALQTIHKMLEDPNLAKTVIKDIRLTVAEVASILEQHLQSGHVDEAARILRSIAQVCAGDQKCFEIVAQALDTASYSDIVFPVVCNFPNHTSDCTLKKDNLMFFQGSLLDYFLRTNC